MTDPPDCCDPAREQAGIRPALAARARAIEAAMPGGRASEREWRVLLGQEGGSLPWPVMERLLRCVDEASRQPGSRLECR